MEDGAGLPRRAWRQYLLRVAYLALTRIMLYRAWEDVEFVPSYLYNGGFNDAYRLVEEVERLVCALYAVPDDLTEEVVAHAVRRAESAT